MAKDDNNRFLPFIAFEICQTPGTLLKTFAADFSTAEEASSFCERQNAHIDNPKRTYAWIPQSEAPEMKV